MAGYQQGANLLKDSLKALAVKAEDNPPCRIGQLIKEFDPETAEAFVSAMRSPASSRSIWSALRESEVTVDRAAIDKARACFKGKKECHCLSLGVFGE